MAFGLPIYCFPFALFTTDQSLDKSMNTMYMYKYKYNAPKCPVHTHVNVLHNSTDNIFETSKRVLHCFIYTPLILSSKDSIRLSTCTSLETVSQYNLPLFI